MEGPDEGRGPSAWRHLLVVFLLGSLALADVFAVAKPTTRTVPINGTATPFEAWG